MPFPPNNRLRLVYIPQHDVLGWFAGAANGWIAGGTLMLPIVSGLPKDARVVSVHSDYRRRDFQFTIHSEMFSEVPCGQEIPQWEGNAPMRYEVVELRTDADREREAFMLQNPPRIWHFPKPSEDSKAAVIKFAAEQMERTNVLMPMMSQSCFMTVEEQLTLKESVLGVHTLEIRGDKVLLAHHPDIVAGSFAEYNTCGDEWKMCVVDKILNEQRRYEITFNGQEFTCGFKSVRPLQWSGEEFAGASGFPGPSGAVGCIGVLGPENKLKYPKGFEQYIPEKDIPTTLPPGVDPGKVPMRDDIFYDGHMGWYDPSEKDVVEAKRIKWNEERPDRIAKCEAEQAAEKSAPIPGDEADDMLSFFKGK